ncbi:12017_t:CDS:2, partial [Funneliformis geosporum]
MQKSNSTVEYLDNTSPNVWTLDGLAEWYINTFFCDKKKVIEYIKTALENVRDNQQVSDEARKKADELTLGRLGVKHHVHCDAAIKLAQIKSKETIILEEVRSSDNIQRAKMNSEQFRNHSTVAVEIQKSEKMQASEMLIIRDDKMVSKEDEMDAVIESNEDIDNQEFFEDDNYEDLDEMSDDIHPKIDKKLVHSEFKYTSRASDLELWKVFIPTEGNDEKLKILQDYVENNSHVEFEIEKQLGGVKLSPSKKIREIFDKGPEDDHIHIIIKRHGKVLLL